MGFVPGFINICMHVIEKTSKWAIWAQRMGNFALPLSVLPIWFHRTGLMTSQVFQYLILFAMILAFLAVLFGVAAFFRIWQTGDHGWGRASLAILIGLVCLSPIIYAAILAARYPLTNDVTTDWENKLTLTQKDEPPVSSLLALPEEIQLAFPQARTHIYSLTAPQMFGLIQELLAKRQWQVISQVSPEDTGGRTGRVNALAMTLLGWRDEVVLRVMSSRQGTKVDMRSASLNGTHDLGSNGLRIEKFLTDLDALAAIPQKDQ